MATAIRKGEATNSTARFGTFAGVFTPNVLTILGIILFLRIGWVVGQAGLWGALAIVILANTISFLTGLSLSAIATNMKVKAGGNYYLISRSLGLEIGGAIGIPLFLSQAISVAFYIIGFTEALASIAFFADMSPQIIATIVTLIFVFISYIGADFALKIQYFILAILVFALGSFFIGGIGSFGEAHTATNYSEGISFWVVFAVFFPAVTGIEVGTSLSGDLKEPSKSIPQGTITSILITAVIYILVVIWFAFNSTSDELINNNLVMQNIALVPSLILAGVWASTLSSALGSVLAAPRTLQAIARDRVVPRWMALQLGSPTEPRMAVLLTGMIATVVIWMGDLNVVAPIISMFFLNTYGMVNLSASVEQLVGNPSYRPRFNIPWYVSMAGALGCYGAMFLINPLATIAAIVISYSVYFGIKQRQIRRTWGDVRSGVWFALARYALLRLEDEAWSLKNWRPNLMVFTGQPHNREQLVEVAEWLSLGRGIVTFFQLIVGNFDELAARDMGETARKHIRSYIQKRDMTAFAEAEIVADFRDGALTVVQAHGIGGLAANTVLMGWSNTASGRVLQMELMVKFVALHKSVLFLNYNEQRGFGNQKVINVWWKGRGANADLMLLLTYLIEKHHSWENPEVRLIRIVDNEEAVEDTRAHLAAMINEVRVEAKPMIILRDDPSKKLAEVIQEASHDADLTVLGLDLPDEADFEVYSERVNTLVVAVGSVLLVRNSEAHEDLLTVD